MPFHWISLFTCLVLAIVSAWITIGGAAANKAAMKYAAFSPATPRRLAFIAKAIARLRRASLKPLVQQNHRQALLLSLSPAQRQGLPKLILDLLEARMHVVGDLTQAMTEVPPGDPQGDPPASSPPLSVMSRTARIGQTTRPAFVYGLRLKHQTKFDTPIHGIALDDRMAIDESPLYQHDAFETTQLGFPPGQIVATAGGPPIPLPDYEAFLRLKQDLLDQVLRFGPYAAAGDRRCADTRCQARSLGAVLARLDSARRVVENRSWVEWSCPPSAGRPYERLVIFPATHQG